MKRYLLHFWLTALILLIGGNARAGEYLFAPTQTTQIWASGNSENTDFGDKNFYDAEATSWLCTQVNISGGNLNNQNAAYGGSYAVVTKFDESEALAGMNIQKATLKFNSVCTVSSKNSNVIISSIGTDWDAATVTWNNMNKAATQLSEGTGTNVKTSTVQLTQDVTELLANDADKVIAFAIYTYTAREQKITDIVLEVEAVDAASSADVTLRYVDGSDKELKTATAVGASNNTLSLTNEQKANFFVDGIKYIYVSDNSADITVASDGSSVITLVYREAAQWTYTINAIDSEEKIIQTLSSATAPEGEKVNVGYAAYINVDGILWSTGKNYSNDGKGFQTSVTMSENNIVKNLTYTKKEIENVVFLSEGENIEGMQVCNTANAGVRSSNAAAAFAPTDVTVTKLPAGKYQLYGIFYDAQKNPNSTWTFKADAVEIASISCTTINYFEANAVNFTLGKESNIIIAKGGNNSIGLDMLYIVKTGDVTEEEAAAANAAAAIAEAKADFLAAIAEAKAIDTTDKNGAEALATAIGTAETAIAAEDATVESIAAAKAALADAIEAFNQANFDPATAIVNADFASMEGWTEYVSGSFKDYGNGLIGTYRVRTDDFIPAATVDETHLATEYCIGLEARWEGNYASYNQNVTLPAGNYKLTFDVENVNAGTNNATYNNLFKVTVGETVYTDESTEWMKGKSAWTSHAIRFILAEEATVNISLGYGTGSNNFGHANTPALYVSHLALGTFDPMADSKEIALKAVDALPVGDGLFMYPEAAITTAKGAIESATTVDEVNAAVTTAKAAQSKPAADKAYAIANTTATGNLCITTEKVSVAKDASVFFTEVEGGYVLSNEAGEYILKTAGNTWTLSTTTTKEEAYVVNFNLADGAYTIQGANGLFGLDSTDEGSTVYANKAQSNNGLWTIAEYVAPVKTDYTDYIVNADLKGEGGFDAAGTKGFDGSGIVKASTQAEFDFKQTISIPSGYYRLTAQAAYRYGGDETAEAAAITEGTATKLLKMYVKIGDKEFSVPVQNRYDGASETNLASEGAVLVNDKYVPNSSSAVQAWFAAGKYVNEVIFNLPADGDVTIGINRIATPESDYTVIGPWTLTRLGDAEVEPEPEPIEGIIYSWESPEGTPIETGGTIAYVNGDGDRLNYAQGGYYTICLNGKKGNMNDETASANAGKMVITLDKAVAEGDTIAYTAFINKNETKEASPYIVFENGTTAEGEVFGDEANIDATFNGVPTLKYTIVPAEAAGSKTITLTRSKTGTNLFITKLQIIEKKAEPEPEPVDPIDYTSKIVNPSFEDGTTGWTYEPSNDHGAKENSNGTYTMTGCDGNYIFNIWSSGNAISQKVEGLPNGTYKLKAVIATDGGHKVQLNANGKSVQIDAIDKGTGVEGELEFNVLDGTATIGAEGVDKYWYKVDNFRLYFIKGFDIDELVTAYETALADAKTVEGNMNAEVKTALEAAIAAEVDKTNAEALGTTTATLVNATADAKASVAAYANAATILPKMKELTESTNVYTAEAYEQYYNQWVVKYEAATLTTAEANALQNPFLVTGWRASITCDNFLLSAWDTNPDFQDAPYYINSWSVEGENDGSNFKVPFFEYWTGDANSLGERTLTATMNDLPEGKYDVTAWVRVRTKNEAGADTEAYGITLSVNEGEAIDVTKGEMKIALEKNNNFYLQEFTATGEVAADGVLKIQFKVAADNNISWLSFKNVKYAFNETATGIHNINAEKTAGKGIYNLSGQKVNKAEKGLFIINGKKVVK